MEHREKARLWLATLVDIRTGVAARAMAEAGLKVLTAASDREKMEVLYDLHSSCGREAMCTVAEELSIDLVALVEAARLERLQEQHDEGEVFALCGEERHA